MSKQANADILKQLINNAVNNDQVLRGIVQAANGVVTMDNAASMAISLGNILLGQNQGDDAVASAMVNGFKAVLYVDWTTKTGQQLNDNNMHNNLVNMRNQIVNGLSSAGVSTGGTGSIFSSAPAGGNGGLFSGAANNSAGLFSSAPASNTTPAANTTANLFGAPATAAAEPIFASAPTVEKPQPAPVEAKSSQIQKVGKVEKYADHELTIDYSKSAVPPRRTNEAIKQYSQSNNWGDVLEAAMEAGSRVIVFGESEVIGKVNYSEDVFAGTCPTTKEALRDFVNRHGAALSSLNNLELEDDTSRIMSRVQGVVDELRSATTDYVNEITADNKDGHTAAMDCINLAGIYQDRLASYIETGFRIGTDGFKAPNGKKFKIDNPFVDLKEFGTAVYNQFCDGNGVCAEEDYFRDMFLTVGRAITKLSMSITDRGDVVLRENKFTLATAGEYNNIDKDNVVSVNTFGPVLSTVVSDVYHRLNSISPTVWMTVRTPHRDVLVLSSEDGAVVRY